MNEMFQMRFLSGFGKQRKNNGFALIELLIVVGIIGVLAAIAVPNFLQAQMRSKVARCKAEMYTLSAALEIYCADHNDYPYSGGLTPTGAVHIPTQSMAGYANKFLPPLMTTPVDYLRSLPLDLFAPAGIPHPELQYLFYTNLKSAKQAYPGEWIPSHEYRMNVLGPWVLWSCGPDQDRIDLSPTKIGAFGPLYLGYYDPTNGTISDGDILRTQKYSSLGG